MRAFARTREGRLQRERIRHAEFAPHHHPRGALLALLHPEAALWERERLGVVFAEYLRVDFIPELSRDGDGVAAVFVVHQRVARLGILAPVREDVLLATVAVHVAEEHRLTLLREFSYHRLGVPDGGVRAFVRFRPHAVQIRPGERTPIVAVDDAVGVEHRHNLEHEVVAQHFRVQRVPGEKIYRAFHHPRAVRLAGVHARGQHRASLSSAVVALVGTRRRDGQRVASIPGERRAHRLPREPSRTNRILLQSSQVQLEIGVRVRIAIRHVARIPVVFERDGERRRVMTRPVPTSNVVLVVAHVLARAFPPAPLPRVRALAEHQRAHPVDVQRVALDEVDDVELDGDAATGV